MIKVTLLSFSDGRARVHDSLNDYIIGCRDTISHALTDTGEVTVVCPEQTISSNALAEEAAGWALGQKPDACILNVPVFAFPNFAGIVARVLADMPKLAIAPVNGLYPGLGGLQAAAGFIRQTGGHCEKVWGNMDDPTVLEKVMVFLRGAHAASGLKGQVFGLFGGRSIGIGTGASSPDVWLNRFGVDIDHVDQLEIIRRSRLVPEEKTHEAFEWLVENIGAIEYDGDKLTPATLSEQINCYIALKEIIAEKNYAFVGVKCHYEMSEYFVTMCLAAALSNDPYDWDGKKEPVALACEADEDAGLTMQVLKLISGKPVLFMDFRHYFPEDGLFAFCNCGACATWYASRCEKPYENLKKVRLCPIIAKYGGGGCHVQFIAAEGVMTFARLIHHMNHYVLQAFEGEFRSLPAERLKETCTAWPHGYTKVQGDPMALLERFESNHIHAVSGRYLKELEAFCRLKDIEFQLL